MDRSDEAACKCPEWKQVDAWNDFRKLLLEVMYRVRIIMHMHRWVNESDSGWRHVGAKSGGATMRLETGIRLGMLNSAYMDHLMTKRAKQQA